jgi:small-conductance mechanosensitive channel
VNDTDERELGSAINRDGLLDLAVGLALVLGTGLGFLGWQLMRNPGVFAAFAPILAVTLLELARKRHTYPRLGCPGYEPEREKRFATIALAIAAGLGAVAFLVVYLAGGRVLAPLFERAPAVAALAGSGLAALLAWWYRSYRLLGYIPVAAAAAAAGWLLDANMLARMALLAATVGLAMTAVGAVTLARFLHAPPLVGSSR